MDDLLLCEIQGANRYLFLGRTGSDTLTVTKENDAVFNVGTNKALGSALGDLNRDGFDDFALFRVIEVDDAHQGSVFVFYGSAS